MNVFNWKRSTAVGLLIAAGLTAWQSGSAQDAAEDITVELREPASEEAVADVLIERRESGGATFGRKPLNLKTKEAQLIVRPDDKGHVLEVRHAVVMSDKMRVIRETAAALSSAEDDAAREGAREKLDSLLNEYFEEDIKRREKELADVEERVKKLQAQLERRREKKSDIIELQIKVLLNEADGLGFFGNDGPTGPWSFGSSGDNSFFWAPPPQFERSSGPSNDGARTYSPQPDRVPLPPGAAPSFQPAPARRAR